MITLIAESKTMTDCSEEVSRSDYNTSCPAFAAQADEVMARLSGLSVPELSAAVKISLPMAVKLRSMIMEFPDKSRGARAITAFTGVVFKALDYNSFSVVEKSRLAERVAIISSLYGWLRPDDIIKSYRFDFTTRLTPNGDAFAAYWKKDVTDALLAELKKGEGEPMVVDLLPGDAAKAIDWKSVSEIAKVRKVDFRTPDGKGGMRTPDAGRLKRLRGHLLREMTLRDIRSVEELMSFESDQCYCEGETADGHILFLA